MLIALDFDKTYTEDPDLWLSFIEQARGRGHQVMIVTMRYPHETESLERQLKDKVDRIVYTSRKGKLRHMTFLELPVDIWIDDRPDFILGDSAP